MNLLVLWLFFPLYLFADTVFIEALSRTPDGVDPESMNQLLQDAARGQGLQVVDTAKKADETITVKIIKLGDSYILAAQKMKGDKVIHATRLKARRLDELDEVSSRIFRALARNVDALEDANPSDVTQDEVTLGTQRKKGREGSTVGAGLSMLGHLGVQDIGWYFYFGKAWAAGPIYLGYRFNFGLDNIKSNESPADRNWAWFSDFGLSISSYLTQSDTSPFLMGELGYALARHAQLQSTSGGMLAAVGAGIGLFRTYDIHVQVGLRFSAIFQTAFPETPYTGALMVGASF